MFSPEQLEKALKNNSLDQTLHNQQANSNLAADIRSDKAERPRWSSRITLDLTTAMDFKNLESGKIMGQPFDSFYVEQATDDNTAISIAFTSEELFQQVNYQTLKKSDSMSFGRTVNRCYLSWAAQSGKNITIVFYLGASFKAGSYRQVLSGGVVVSTGVAMTPKTPVSVLTTATSIFAADSTRAKATIQNLGGSDIYISGVNTVTIGSGILPGIKIGPNDTFEWQNTGACYGIADGSASTVSLNTEG